MKVSNDLSESLFFNILFDISKRGKSTTIANTTFKDLKIKNVSPNVIRKGNTLTPNKGGLSEKCQLHR